MTGPAGRPWLLLFVVVAGGLAVHRFIGGRVGDVAGDVLYAAMVYLLVVVLRPRWAGRPAAAVAVCWCFAVEFLQLTDVPRTASDVFAPSALVLGSGFDGWDLVAYVVGVAGAAGVVAVRCPLPTGSGAGEPCSPCGGDPSRNPAPWRRRA